MRAYSRFVVLLALLVSAWGCQSASGGPDPVSDEAKLRAGAAPQKCGTNTCEKGMVCCNASCGICTPPGGVCIQLACDPADAGKSCAATQCATGETCMDTRSGPHCVAPEESPCNLIDCPPNAICKVVQGAARCETIPAPSVDAGQSVDPGPKPTPGSCALVLCAGICRDVPGGFICEPKAEPKPDAGAGNGAGSCAAALCPVGTYCDDISGQAKCIKSPTCDNTRCAAGQHCELTAVQCIRAPCPAQPTCVPDTTKDVCATVRCAAGTHCEAKQVQCIRAPCPPIAECVPDTSAGTKCGKNICTGDSFCCNASCGTCAPKGGACTQQLCDASN